IGTPRHFPGKPGKANALRDDVQPFLDLGTPEVHADAIMLPAAEGHVLVGVFPLGIELIGVREYRWVAPRPADHSDQHRSLRKPDTIIVEVPNRGTIDRRNPAVTQALVHDL